MSTPDPRLRIGDSDRERAMADLAGHYAEGRLEHEEYDERLDAIWTARTRSDLALLFNDLPRPQPARPATKPMPASRGRRGRFPLAPVVVALVLLSALTHAPFWLLVLPLLFLRSRGGMAHVRHTAHPGQDDYRRTRSSQGW